MEFLEGVTLKDLILSKGALPVGVGLRIAKQMCQGLDAAHRQGVIHRDIKPQNMLILPETGELKIMDFGIARATTVKAGRVGPDDRRHRDGHARLHAARAGAGHPADFRSDIYSLGVVLFEVFTGKLPFTADSVMKIVLAHIQQPPPAPRTLNPRTPGRPRGDDPALPLEGPARALPARGRHAEGPDGRLLARGRRLGGRLTATSRRPA